MSNMKKNIFQPVQALMDNNSKDWKESNNNSSANDNVINGIKTNSKFLKWNKNVISVFKKMYILILLLLLLLLLYKFIYLNIDEIDAAHPTVVMANRGNTGELTEISFVNNKVAGSGSFGVVFKAKLIKTGEVVAIKKVLQDKRFKVNIVFLINNESYIKNFI